MMAVLKPELFLMQKCLMSLIQSRWAPVTGTALNAGPVQRALSVSKSMDEGGRQEVYLLLFCT